MASKAEQQQQPHDRIFSILFQEDELTWQNIIYDLVRTEEMDPWNINITLIAQKFIDRLKELKKMDFRISGKVVLASAMLLKMKTNKLMDEDILAFDNLINEVQEADEPLEVLEEIAYNQEMQDGSPQNPKIVPRTPQPRKRKVSVFDLVDALEKALDVKSKKKNYITTPNNTPSAPKKGRDLTQIMDDVYGRVKSFFKNNAKQSLSFDQLTPSESKEDRVFTFVPLLHLENQTKIDMDQQQHFGNIFIKLTGKSK